MHNAFIIGPGAIERRGDDKNPLFNVQHRTAVMERAMRGRIEAICGNVSRRGDRRSVNDRGDFSYGLQYW